MNETSQLRCKSGSYGVLPEEVYVDASHAIVKYNLAFIHHLLCQADNVLCDAGLIRLRRQVNPGHGHVQIVEARARRFELRCAI